jgi:hypothetical protein
VPNSTALATAEGDVSGGGPVKLEPTVVLVVDEPEVFDVDEPEVQPASAIETISASASFNLQDRLTMRSPPGHELWESERDDAFWML